MEEIKAKNDRVIEHGDNGKHKCNDVYIGKWSTFKAITRSCNYAITHISDTSLVI